MLRVRKAQSTLEYAILIIIIIGVFIAMQQYIERGFQGRWKASIDDFGEQYDPRLVNSIINYAIVVNSDTLVTTIPETSDRGATGAYTKRSDSTHSVETKTAHSVVGADVAGQASVP